MLIDLLMMLTKEIILEKLTLHKPQLMEKYPIKSIGLFGSYARNEPTPESDIDVLVAFSSPVGMEIVDLADDLERILHHKVDLITYNAIKNRLYHYIKDELIYA